GRGRWRCERPYAGRRPVGFWWRWCSSLSPALGNGRSVWLWAGPGQPWPEYAQRQPLTARSAVNPDHCHRPGDFINHAVVQRQFDGPADVPRQYPFKLITHAPDNLLHHLPLARALFFIAAPAGNVARRLRVG